MIEIIGYGGIGVTMFAFLSGIGLWQSLERNNNIERFYIKRIQRVVIPYLLISATFNLYFYIGIHRNLAQFVADLCCVSFWQEGRGAWYVAWIIPVYLIYPLYAKIAHKHSWISLIMVAFIMLVILMKGIPTRFQSVAGATVAFFIGDFFAKYIKEDKIWCLLTMGSLIFMAPIYLSGILRNQTTYVFFFAAVGISLCAIFTVALKYIPNTLKRFLQRVGEVSLECYLVNIYLITVSRHLFSEQMSSGLGAIIYLMIAILGIIVSLLIGKIRKRVN